MNIVLDMDQTLIDGWYLQKVTPRPHLKTFLKWCFENFTHVSIWTAASRDWYNYVYNAVFKNILDEINAEFHFVFTSEKCNNVWKYSEWHGHSIRWTEKRVRKLHRYKSLKYINYNIDNTIIIDDNPSTFNCNYGNGIHISPFKDHIKGWDTDEELLNLMIYLRNVVIPHYQEYGSILGLEKRYWRNYVLNDPQQEALDKTSMFPNQR